MSADRPPALRSPAMKRSFAALLALACTIPLQADPGLQPDKVSLRLVAALRIADAIIQTSNAGIADAQKRGSSSAYATECMARGLVANLGSELAMQVPKILTREEITAAVKFFESPTGRKLMAHNLAMLQQQRDGRPDPKYPDPAPSAEDTKLAKEFLATSAGKKLNETGYLLQAPQTLQLLNAKKEMATKHCKAAAPDPKPKAK